MYELYSKFQTCLLQLQLADIINVNTYVFSHIYIIIPHNRYISSVNSSELLLRHSNTWRGLESVKFDHWCVFDTFFPSFYDGQYAKKAQIQRARKQFVGGVKDKSLHRPVTAAVSISPQKIQEAQIWANSKTHSRTVGFQPCDLWQNGFWAAGRRPTALWIICVRTAVFKNLEVGHL